MIDRESLDRLARNIGQHAFGRGYVSAFTLAAFPVDQDEDLSVHITRECEGLVYGNAEVGSPEALKACVDALDGHVDYIVYDTALPFDISGFREGPDSSTHRKSILLPYCDLHVWVESVRHTLLALVPDLPDKNVLVTGLDRPTDKLRDFLWTLVGSLQSCCGNIWAHRIDKEIDEKEEENIKGCYTNADIIIGAAVYTQVVQADYLRLCKRDPLIIDAGIGTLKPEAAKYAGDKGLKMIRVDNRAAMAGMLFTLIQSHDLVTRVMGIGEVGGVPVVAGGVIGPPGTIVVDSIDKPTIVIGFADGTGRIRYGPDNDEEAERMRIVQDTLGAEISGG